MKENAPSTPNETKAEQAEVTSTYDGLGRDTLTAIRDASANLNPDSSTPSADLRTSVREALENTGVKNGFRRVSDMNNNELKQFVNGADTELASRYRSELDAVIDAFDSHDSFGDRRTALTEALKASGDEAAWRTVYNMSNQDISAFVNDARTRLQELETPEAATNADEAEAPEAAEAVADESNDSTEEPEQSPVEASEEVAEDVVEDTVETQNSDHEALETELQADAEALEAALTRSDAEAEAAAERTSDTAETDEDDFEDEEPTPEAEDTLTKRELRHERRAERKEKRAERRANREIAKREKQDRKELKKQLAAEARAKVVQDKREEEVLNYNRDQQHGIVKKSRIGSVIRRLKGIPQKVSGAFKRSAENTTLSTPDTDATPEGGRHANNKETPEQVPGDFIEPKAVIRGRERSVVEYNDAMSRVIGGLRAQGLGDFEAEYKPEPTGLNAIAAKADKKAAEQAKAAAEQIDDNQEKKAA